MVEVIAHSIVWQYPKIEEENGHEFARFFKGDFKNFGSLRELIERSSDDIEKGTWIDQRRLDKVFGISEPSVWSIHRSSEAPILVLKTKHNKYFLAQISVLNYFRQDYYICAISIINDDSEFVLKVYWHTQHHEDLESPKEINEVNIPGDIAAELVKIAYEYCKKKNLFWRSHQEGLLKEDIYESGTLDKEIEEIIQKLKER